MTTQPYIEGQHVIARWTNSNRTYESKGEIVRVNAKTVRVKATVTRMVASYGNPIDEHGNQLPSAWGEHWSEHPLSIPLPGTKDNRIDPDPEHEAPSEADVIMSRTAKLTRLEEKAERFDQYRTNAAHRSNAAYAHSKEMADMIPLGQPILVDHYSAPRHRRHIQRIGAAMDKSIREADKAAYWDSKAARINRQIRALGLHDES